MTPTLIELRMKQTEAAKRMLPQIERAYAAIARLREATAKRIEELLKDEIAQH